MSGLRRVGKLRKGMRVRYDGKDAIILGFPTRNMVSLKIDGNKEPTKMDINVYWMWVRNVL
jgi:hypothetical protein